MRPIKCLHIFLIFAFGLSSIAQNEYDVSKYNPKLTAADQHSYVVHYDYQNRILDFPFVREDDILWTKRYLTKVNLKERPNLPLYFPTTPVSMGRGKYRTSLAHLLIEKVKVGEITAYDETPEDYFTVIKTPEEIKNELSRVDSMENEDFFTGEFVMEYDTINITAADARSFYILEDKFFDKKRSVLESRIIGLALIANKENAETGDMEPEVLFWVWYPEVRQVLANNFLLVDNQKYVGTKHMTYDEFLTKRLYTSTIIKETNMFDRAIYEYKKTAMQQLLEADRIKNDIRYLESDLWEY
jgi:gliding motility associated protien GldN